MLTLTVYMISFHNLLLLGTAIQNPLAFTPTDLILLNCGTPSNTTSLDGRNWKGDAHSKFLASSNSPTLSASETSPLDPLVTLIIPYTTARIFHSRFTYTFPVSPGPKFIRLYFYPAVYSGLNPLTSFFTVNANSYTLLSNFSAYLTVSAMNPAVSYFFREFIVTVWDNQVLNIIFTPAPKSFAFINGIEVVSMPNNLYTTDIDNRYPLVNYNTFFYFHNTTSLETVYRVNVGGRFVANVNDTGMFRTWLDDSNYIFGGATGVVHKWRDDVTIKYTNHTPAYTAPAEVYITQRTMGRVPYVNLNYNLTWFFPVDSGFNYLVRLHFCENEVDITGENQRVFSIFINHMTAETEADVMVWSGGSDIPVYRDYVVWVPEGRQSKQDLWLALHPSLNSKPRYADAILSGLEILKLNKLDGSLAGSNPELIVVPSSPDQQQSSLRKRAKSKWSSIVAAIIGAVIGALSTLSLSLYLLNSKWKRQEKGPSSSGERKLPIPQASPLPTDICRRFTIFEIKEATKDFDYQNLIGSGGFGKVYKGFIVNGSITVAIKRLDYSSNQGTREFKTEIEMLSQLCHVNLVSLIGYCIDEGEMMLVYDYMINGTLREHLYETKDDPLPWKQRLEICIGAARGLHYLHTGLPHTIIHRDVKTSNILLDENWIARVSDFGLSRIGLSDNAVSTAVKGTWGYLDPEYARFQQLTAKSDVYSFGVVLFEVLCGRKPLDHKLEHKEKNLANWAQECIQNGTIYLIIDPYLKAKIAPECFRKFVEIAESCVRNQGSERPTMQDVMGELEFALELQETADADKERINPGGEYVYPEVSFNAPSPRCTNPGGCEFEQVSTSGYTSWDTNNATPCSSQ
ncbi:hypothetical protein P3X46_016320 [Hevea brasiliensis]|uniref:Protein kinase domain-containing protein n=2 Tax=Hevea brasiliensis TaxID=3981 RepID=A0ABQ9LYW2_HEVBR|nr:hypothetical protein P3X46_016320 [Hevea brasiliensis]